MPRRADAHKQQQQQQKEEESGSAPVSAAPSTATSLTNQDQRKALKFGFSSKGGTLKVYPTYSYIPLLGYYDLVV